MSIIKVKLEDDSVKLLLNSSIKQACKIYPSAMHISTIRGEVIDFAESESCEVEKGVVSQLCEALNISESAMIHKGRSAGIALKRHAAYWYLRNQGYTFQGISKILQRNHTSVMWGCKKVDKILSGPNTPKYRALSRLMPALEALEVPSENQY